MSPFDPDARRAAARLQRHNPHWLILWGAYSRHLRVFGELEAERDDIHRKLAALAQETNEHGGDSALLDRLPLLGDVLPRLPERIKQRLFEAFDLAMLYSKKHNQVTCWATITPATPATLAAIIAEAGIRDLAAYLAGHDHVSDLARQPGTTTSP